MRDILFKYALMCLYVLSLNAYAQDTIPFVLGSDNRIYIKAKINNSKPLDFIFDTGANAMVVNTTVTNSKLNLKFDGSTENTGANGTVNQKVSRSNTIQIGKFKRKNEALLGIAYPTKYYTFDGVIGYPFFEDYLLEINYKLQKLVLHKSKRTIRNIDHYNSAVIDMTLDVPVFDFTIFKTKELMTFPVLIDTGFNGELIVYNKIVSKFGLLDQFEKIGDSKSEGTDGMVISSDQVIIPKARIGDETIENITASLNRTPVSTRFTAIMGGELLKQLNWILDFKRKTCYTLKYN